MHDLTAEQKARQESLKLLFEVYKHITTLSTGAIVIIATLLEKLFKSPQEVYLVATAVSFFLAAVVSSLIMMAHLAVEQQLNRKINLLDRIAKRALYIMSPLFFCLGVFCLVVFSAKNFQM
jgi:ABC-type Fe3+-siderophore transport system permease subunit